MFIVGVSIVVVVVKRLARRRFLWLGTSQAPIGRKKEKIEWLRAFESLQ